MKNNLIKKYSVLFVGMIYMLSYFFQSLSFFNFSLILNTVYAEDQLDYTNLVAVFVDDKIYDDIENDMQRYAQEYIQWEDSSNRYNSISNSKAIVLPIDTDNMSASDITKILENMYFDGISGEPSKLIWTVLVWDIPLPVVNQDGFIYPTVYPYVDFEEQKFIWNDQSKYFVYNDNPDGEAEIWHWIINFDEIWQYENYFDKLQNYSDDPSEFIGKNIRYDDLIANKQYFYKEAINSYVNSFMFAEDLGYRRYTDLMVKLMQDSHNDMIADLLSWFDGMEELQATTESMNTPTMTLETMIKDGFIKSYSSLIWWKQLDNIVRNVETANRWIEQYTWSDWEWKARTALDTHYLKMEQKDETLLRMNWGLDPLIITFNNAFEDIVNDKIEEEKYWLNEVIPLTYLEYDGYKKYNLTKFNCVWKEYNAFENYFFGTKASGIWSMQETSTYRWTFRNLDDIAGLTVDDIQSGDHPSSDIDDTVDLNKKSVWWSYDIFATQVDANRWYNITNTISELDTYNEKKIPKMEYWNTKCDKKFLGICWRKRRWESDTAPEDHLCDPNDEELQWWCELPQEFAVRNRWWASPLNLSWMDAWKSWYNFQDAIMPVFDIAGSKQLTSWELEANSFEWVEEYTRLIQKTFVPDGSKYYTKNKDKEEPANDNGEWYTDMWEDMKFTNRLAGDDLDDPTWTYTNPKLADDVDYFDQFDSNAHIEWGVIKIIKEDDDVCVWKGEIFTYKTLDSRVKNNLSTSTTIDGSSYKVFQDPQSPVKLFYDGIVSKMSSIDDEVQTKIDTLNISTQSGLTYNLNDLWNYIQGIEDDINDILNYSVWSLSSLSNSQKQALADERESSFAFWDVAIVTGKIENIKDQFLDLDGFTEDFSYDDLSSYIDQQYYNFNINNWSRVLLDTWRDNIFNQLSTTENKFNSIGWLIWDAEDEYEDISKIPLTLNSLLLTKRGVISASVTNSSWVALWCNSSYYGELCNAIDDVRDNLSDYRVDINDSIDEIPDFEFNDYNLDGTLGPLLDIQPFGSISGNIINSDIDNDKAEIYGKINIFPVSSNTELTASIKWMNMTTSDRPIDSPKYITFKWIGWDKVSFIYPNIYKSEIFSGDSSILKLKSPENIAVAIKEYLKETVKKYNEYLLEQYNGRYTLYGQNPNAYNLLENLNPLADPTNMTARSYNLMDEDILIEELEERLNNGAFFDGQMWDYEPIEFISHMIYYQNIAWQQRELWDTIEEEMSNNRSAFDVNEKISHIVDNYLVSENNKWNFITPWYRDEGYEVAFINSDGSDYIDYKDDPDFVQRVTSASQNYNSEAMPNIEQTQLEEELQNECNIPEDGWVMLFDLQEWWSPWLKAVRCWREKTRSKPAKFSFDRSSSLWPVFNLW